MSATIDEKDNYQSAAECLRLAISLLGKNKLPTTPVNYALAYFYVAGTDSQLNEKLDEFFADISLWSEKNAFSLFKRYICFSNDPSSNAFRSEILILVEQLLGSIFELTGKTSLSNTSLEGYVDQLSSCDDPLIIKSLAKDIVDETNSYITSSKDVVKNLNQSTEEIKILKKELGQAKREASIDSLTQLHNRRSFDKALKESIAPKNNTCLIILDIDDFKAVNDKHGHLVGDRVLVTLSKLLSNKMRGNDHLSRFGGEEFSIILRDTSITGAFTVAEKLRQSVEKYSFKKINNTQLQEKITISIGVAYHAQNETSRDFIQRCDKALYRAKSLGKNRCILAE